MRGLEPGEEVTIFRTPDAIRDDGPCPRTVPGFCLDLERGVKVTGRPIADADGVATITVPVPNVPDGFELCSQAAASRGVDGVDSVRSTAVCGGIIDP